MTAADTSATGCDHADHQQPVRRQDLDPRLGTVPNNYMNLYDPRPGHALSLAPGKRVTSRCRQRCRSATANWLRARPARRHAHLPRAMQAIVNLIDHGMTLQEAVEAPRVWTRALRSWSSSTCPRSFVPNSTSIGHNVVVVPKVAGGMNGIQFHDDGRMSGAACWRADGTPVGLAGGLARRRRSGWRETSATHPPLSYPRRRVSSTPRLSARSLASLEYWVTRPSAQLRTRRVTTTSAYFRTADHADHGCLRIERSTARIDAIGLEEIAHGVRRHQDRLRRGRALARPATSTGFQQFATAANLPSLSSAAAPEKPSDGGGDNAMSLLPPSWATEALRLAHRGIAALVCGSAMPVRSSAVLVAASARLSAFSPRAP